MLEINNINTRIFYIKYCLLAFTILFALTGLSLVIIGTTINAVFTEFSYFLENKYFAPAVFLYSVGFAVFGISTIGLFGAIKENSCVITAYGILLGVVFILQLAVGMSTNILMEGTIYDQLREKLTLVMTEYNSNIDYKAHVNGLQRGVACCGIFGPDDWKTINHNSDKPSSCCGALASNGTCNFFYQRGCFHVLEYIVTDVANILSASAYVLAIMQLAGMCFALYLGKSLRAQKIAKEYRRWRLTNQLFTPNEEQINYLMLCADKKQQESSAILENKNNNNSNSSNNYLNNNIGITNESFPVTNK